MQRLSGNLRALTGLGAITVPLEQLRLPFNIQPFDLCQLHRFGVHSKPTLAYDELVVKGSKDTDGAPSQTAVFIHGLLGAGKNWRSFARRLGDAAEQRTGRGWRFLLLDLRNHGESARLPGFHPPHNIHSAAEDIIDFIMAELKGSTPDVVVGHSLGGKVTLSLLDLLLHEERHRGIKPPKQLWVLDSDPGRMDINEDKDVDKVLHQIKDIPLPVPSRKWLNDFMTAKGYSQGLSQWLGSNLAVNGSGELMWTFRIEGAAAMYNNYRVSCYWHVLEKPPQGSCLNMVVAQNSDRFTAAMIDQLQEAKLKSGSSPGTLCTHTLEKAGHWLHVDNPAGLASMMLPAFVEPHKPVC